MSTPKTKVYSDEFLRQQYKRPVWLENPEKKRAATLKSLETRRQRRLEIMQEGVPALERITKEVIKPRGITIEEIYGMAEDGRRDRELVNARRAIIARSIRETTLSYSAIARFFGCNVSTVSGVAKRLRAIARGEIKEDGGQ
jgi:DNA invertase Pin-like site-specific DNA recombinase